jgi:hypothetical protein
MRIRTISGPVFTAKTGAGSGVVDVGDRRGRRVGLGEAGRPQAAVTAEQTALSAGDRPGGQRGQLIAAVGLVKRPVRHAEPAQALEAAVELALVGNAADDQVRMGQVWRKEESCGLDSRVTGLDDLLRVGEVLPHEKVDVEGFLALVELHDILRERETVLPVQVYGRLSDL